MIKILLAGDSFASAELSGLNGWPKKLTDNFVVTNLAQPGVGEYKILQQLVSCIDQLDSYQYVIISHTSPYRVHAITNPCYPADHMYAKSDLIFTDIESKSGKMAECLKNYFKFVFDPVYYEFVYRKCCEEIDKLEKSCHTKFIHITHFEWNELYPFADLLNFSDLWRTNKGNFVHYNAHGNEIIYKTLIEKITGEITDESRTKTPS